jgi:1,2-phenylacetyl-CoA epoxidase PaaB subunit
VTAPDRFEVFTRLEPGDDLVHRGSVHAETPALAKSHARSMYDEEDWADMYVVHGDDLHQVPSEPTREEARP